MQSKLKISISLVAVIALCPGLAMAQSATGAGATATGHCFRGVRYRLNRRWFLRNKTKRLTHGVTASMAMPNLAIAPGKKFAMGVDVSTYDGQQAIGFAGAIALDKNWSLQGGFGAGFQGGPAGAKLGLRTQW